MVSRYDSPTEKFKRGLRVTEAVDRSLRAQLPLLGELVEHASDDLDKFELLQPDQPEDIAVLFGEAKAALEGLANVLAGYKAETTPEQQ